MNENLPYNEGELILQLAAGNEFAFQQVFVAYRDKLYSYLYKFCRSEQAAEDAVHDVFLKLWQYRERLYEVENLNAYLYRMAHNHAYTQFQRMARETLILAEIQKEQGLIGDFEGEDRLVSKELKEFIRRAVNRLSPQQRLVFLMSRQDGLTHEQIAQRLNLSTHTIKNHMVEALRHLREDTHRQFGPDALIIITLYGLNLTS